MGYLCSTYYFPGDTYYVIDIEKHTCLKYKSILSFKNLRVYRGEIDKRANDYSCVRLVKNMPWAL